MKKRFPGYILICSIFVAVIALSITACTKIPGHYTGIVASPTTATGSTGSTGSTGTTGSTGNSNLGVGPIAIGPANTILFQVGTGALQTWTTSGYFFGLNSLQVFQSTAYSTQVSGFDMMFTSSLTMGYDNNTPGTYKMKAFILQMPGLNVQNTGATSTLYTKVTTESLGTINVAAGNTVKGTVKGTFDGYATNTTTKDSVRVSGSFNIQQ